MKIFFPLLILIALICINKSQTIQDENMLQSEINTENNQKTTIKNSEEKEEMLDKNKDFWKSFISGFSLIFISEIGDKTFILAMFFSLKIGAVITYITTAITLVSLNAFWLFVGASLNIILYKNVINWIAICLFFLFSIILLVEGLKKENKLLIDELHELEEEEKTKEEELANTDEQSQALLKNNNDKENNTVESKEVKTKKAVTFKVIWGYSMSLILAEMGDKSQITAIAIAAVYDFKGVLMGSSAAFMLAALIAVSVGKIFSNYVTEKILTLIGSFLFFLYGVDGLYNQLYAN